MSFKLTCCFLSARLRGPPSLRPFLCDPRSYSTATAAAAAAAKSAARPSVLMASSTDIAFNLATEAFLKDAFSGFPKQGREAPSEGPGGPPSSRRLLAPEKQGSLLFLWRNDKTIVIGRHQNAWKECDVAQMQKEDVKLARSVPLCAAAAASLAAAAAVSCRLVLDALTRGDAAGVPGLQCGCSQEADLKFRTR
ncbi:hypothetical protein Esti_000439 [Eimeria stiedai]